MKEFIAQGAVQCRVCGNREGNVAYEAREMMYGLRDRFGYFQCGDCGCLQIAEFPEDASRYCPGDYYSFHAYYGKKFRGWKGRLKRAQYRAAALGDRRGPSAAVGMWTWIWNLFLDVLDYLIFKGLSVGLDMRILDVSCGNGRSFFISFGGGGISGFVGVRSFYFFGYGLCEWIADSAGFGV